jgi:hypothetical protein
VPAEIGKVSGAIAPATTASANKRIFIEYSHFQETVHQTTLFAFFCGGSERKGEGLGVPSAWNAGYSVQRANPRSSVIGRRRLYRAVGIGVSGVIALTNPDAIA